MTAQRGPWHDAGNPTTDSLSVGHGTPLAAGFAQQTRVAVSITNLSIKPRSISLLSVVELEYLPWLSTLSTACLADEPLGGLLRRPVLLLPPDPHSGSVRIAP